MKATVVGGAGYAGVHVVRLSETRGDEIAVVDDLSYGSPERIGRAELVGLDCTDALRYPQLLAVMRGVDIVIYFTARRQVGESVQKPTWYYQQSIDGLALVLQAMGEAGIGKMISSSLAAVYKTSDTEIVPEDTEKRLTNPYGGTKLFGEIVMAAYQRAFGLYWTGLRCLNIAGAGVSDLSDPAILNLISMVFKCIVTGGNPLIFKGDCPTLDGTCMHDCAHVQDLAQAHLEALDYINRTGAAGRDLEYHVFNVKVSTGYSVKEAVDVVAKVTGIDFTPEVCMRRIGDPPRLIADSTWIRQIMGLEPRYNLEQIVRSAWEVWRVRPGWH